MSKVTTNICDDLFEKIKVYAEVNNISQTDLINKLLTDGLEQMILERSGAAMFTIPNPQLFSVDRKRAEDVLSILIDAAKQIYEVNANIPLPIFSIFTFLEQRLIYDLPEERKKFKQNMIIDGTLSETLAEDNDSVERG